MKSELSSKTVKTKQFGLKRNKMSWIYLVIAALFEMGWPLGMKMASVTDAKVLWLLFAIVAMALSGYFLYLAQKQIPIGTAYAVWTGIGMLGTFFVGITLFHDAVNIARFIGVFLIFAGVIILKLCH